MEKRACSSAGVRSPSFPSSENAEVSAGFPASSFRDHDTSDLPTSEYALPVRAAGDSSDGSSYSVEDEEADEERNSNLLDGVEQHQGRERGEERISFLSKKKILPVLFSLDDPESSVQMEAFSSLNKIISSASEESICDDVARPIAEKLVMLAENDRDPNTMLLAMKALTSFCKSMRLSAAVMKFRAIPIFCARLKSIDYMDVAEQGLLVLQKISQYHPVACLRAGIITASLYNFRFFSRRFQRVIVSTIRNVCEKVPADSWPLVVEAIPDLCSLIRCDDHKIVEMSVVCLSLLSSQFDHFTESLDDLHTRTLIRYSGTLISFCFAPSPSQPMEIHLLRLFTKLASGSLFAFKGLFELEISVWIKEILLRTDNYQVTSRCLRAEGHGNKIYEMLRLLAQLLPYSRRKDEINERMLKKESLLVQNHTFLSQLVRFVFPFLIKVVNSGASSLFVRYGCVSVIERMVSISSLELILDVTKDINFSRFLVTLLYRRDAHLLMSALTTVQILMEKHSIFFASSLIKEGIVFAIDALQMPENFISSASNSVSVGKSIKETSNCFCPSFKTCDASSSPLRNCAASRETVFNMAKRIKSTYFTMITGHFGPGFSITGHKLKDLCSSMDDNLKINSNGEFSPQNEDNLARMLMEMMGIINGDDSISTFEFIESGFMKTLANYLSVGAYCKAEADERYVHEHYCMIMKRFQRLYDIIDSGSLQNGQSTLVKKLQSALSAFDDFSVVPSLDYHRKPEFANVPRRSYIMIPCLRVQFICEDEAVPKCSSDNVLTVDSLASFEKIEEYLMPKYSQVQPCHPTDSADDDVESIGDEAFHSAVEYEGTMTDLQEYGGDEETSVDEELLRGTTEETISDAESVESVESETLIFYFEGKQVDRSLTVYQAILQHQLDSEDEVEVNRNFWADAHNITYKKIKQRSVPEELPCSCPIFNYGGHFLSWGKLPFSAFMSKGNLPCKLERSTSSYDALFLLKAFESLNQAAQRVALYGVISEFCEGRVKPKAFEQPVFRLPRMDFLNRSLNERLDEQMRDGLSVSTGNLPSWCSRLISATPFLFSFETRWKYACLTEIRRHVNGTDPGRFLTFRPGNYGGRKFPVSRDNILGNALRVLTEFDRVYYSLEVEFRDEIGTGLGPTLEFFTLASREFRKSRLYMWREDSSCAPEYLAPPFGFFPRPWSTTEIAKYKKRFADVIDHFVLLGRLVAKALQDGRVLDLPFSKPFYKLMIGQELDMLDIQSISPNVGKILLELLAVVCRLKKKQGNRAELFHWRRKIDNLLLDFAVPGYLEYVGDSGYTHRDSVSIDNLEEYLEFVVDATIKSGVSRQMEAFKSGFNEVFPMKALSIFTEEDIESLVCGEQNSWTSDELAQQIKFDHGYYSESPPVVMLLEVLLEFSKDQRKAFLQFLTGAPRLPHGGLAALSPPLTVVRKNSKIPDMELPSVTTCVNYLKLPPYSSKEILREKLMYAITEGQGSFQLS